MTADMRLPEFTEGHSMERKLKKPLMEKKRRARINRCLMELKSLLLQASAPQGAKLEKADILEMTVKYLKAMKTTKATTALPCNPQEAQRRFSEGYAACAQTVTHYLRSAYPPQITAQLTNHLQRSLTDKMETLKDPKVGGAFQPVLPPYPSTPTQIPSNFNPINSGYPTNPGSIMFGSQSPHTSAFHYPSTSIPMSLPNARATTPPFRLESISTEGSSSLSPLSCATDSSSYGDLLPPLASPPDHDSTNLKRSVTVWRPF